MELDNFLEIIAGAPVDTGRRGSGMTVKKSDFEAIHATLVEKNHGVVLDFEVVKQLVGSDSNSPNNFVYQLNRQFKKLKISLHAGQRTVKDSEGEETMKIALNPVSA